MKRFVLIIMLTLTLCVESSLASVKINGKSLAQIDDIVEFTTGSRVEDKFSFLKFMKDKSGSYNFLPVFGEVGESGVALRQLDVQETGQEAGRTNTGIYPVAGKKRLPDGRLLVMYPSALDNRLVINSIAISGDNSHNLSQESYWNGVILDETENIYVNDSASGIFPEGNEGHEVFAVTYFIARGGRRPGFVQDYEAYLALIDLQDREYSITSLGTMNGTFPSVRVTAGDFDNNGRANELAVLRNGEDNNYHLETFTVSSGLRLSNANYSAVIGTRNDDGDNIDGCDITAGDFNGDGKIELAAVYANKINHDGYPSVTIFEVSSSGITQRTDDNKDNSLRLGSTYWTRSSYVPHFGIIAEAGDIDDNGSDELVFLTASYGSGEGNIIISIWGADENLQPQRKFYSRTSQKIAGYGGVAGTDKAECSYLPRSLSLALVPVGDKLDTGASPKRIFISRSQGGDSVDSSSDYREGDQTFYAMPEFSGTNLTGLGELTLYTEGVLAHAMALVPGDFFFETLELGEPEHIIIQGHKNYSVALKVPPYHVDFIQAPWMPAAPANPFNFSYLGRNVQYVKTQDEGEENLVTSRTQNASEAGLNFSYNANISAKVPAIAEGSIKYGYSLGASAGLVKVKEESDKSAEKHSLSDKLKTTTADALMYTVADYHIWRYPVIKPDSSAFAGNFEDNELLNEEGSELDGNYFITYTLCDEASEHFCDSNSPAQYDDYNPSYEEGNLFSYPNSLSFGMDDAQEQLSSPKYFDLTTDTAQSLTFTEAGSSTSKLTTSWKAAATSDIHGDINGSVPIKIVNFGGGYSAKLYGKYSHEAANGVTATKTWSDTEKIDISANTNTLLYSVSEAQYTTGSQVFVDAAGVLVTPFSVNFGDGAWLWNYNNKESVQSPYVMKSDPALVLPGRYVQEKEKSESGVINNVWKFTKNEASATKIRGMRIYDNVTKEYVSGALEKGWSYTISVPVYNASFLDVPGEGVIIEYGYQNEDGSGRVQIGRQTLPLKGWSNTQEMTRGGSNKGTLIFDWTPDIDEGDYEFYVVLDPDNLIDEVHESWTKDTPDGNNNGYRAFAVIKTPEVNIADNNEEGNEYEVTSRDFTLRFWDADSDSDSDSGMTAGELRRYVLSQSEDVSVKGRITYNGTQVLRNCEVLILCNSLSDGMTRVISSRKIHAVRPGKVREFNFIMTPEKLSEGRFAVSFSSSNGSFILSGSGESDNGNDDSDSDSLPLGSSSGSCNSGFAFIALILAACFISHKS